MAHAQRRSPPRRHPLGERAPLDRVAEVAVEQLRRRARATRAPSPAVDQRAPQRRRARPARRRSARRSATPMRVADARRGRRARRPHSRRSSARPRDARPSSTKLPSSDDRPRSRGGAPRRASRATRGVHRAIVRRGDHELRVADVAALVGASLDGRAPARAPAPRSIRRSSAGATMRTIAPGLGELLSPCASPPRRRRRRARAAPPPSTRMGTPLTGTAPRHSSPPSGTRRRARRPRRS